MADFSKFKIGSTSYDVKDANAGRSLAFNSGTGDLSLKNAAGTAISTVNIPSGGGGNEIRNYIITYNGFQSGINPDNWDDTGYNLTASVFDATKMYMDGTGVPHEPVEDALLSVRHDIEITLQFLPDAYYALPEMYFKLSGYWENGDNTYTAAFDMPVLDSNGSKVLFQIEINFDSIDGSIMSAKAYKYELGGSGGGGTSIDKYDVKKNGNLLFMASFIGSNDCQIYNGSTALQYSNFVGVDGPWLLNLADGQILITGKHDNNAELYCGIVIDSLPKFVTLRYSYGTTWNVVVANV